MKTKKQPAEPTRPPLWEMRVTVTGSSVVVRRVEREWEDGDRVLCDLHLDVRTAEETAAFVARLVGVALADTIRERGGATP